jgi:hypothetical protein
VTSAAAPFNSVIVAVCKLEESEHFRFASRNCVIPNSEFVVRSKVKTVILQAVLKWHMETGGIIVTSKLLI